MAAPVAIPPRNGGENTRRMEMSTTLACMTEPIPSASDYRAANRSEKSNMRSTMANTMRAIMDGIMDGSISSDDGFARYGEWRAMESEWKSNTRSTVVRDYDGAIADRIATLGAAIVALRDGIVTPSDVPDGTELTFDSTGTANMADAVAIASAPLFRAPHGDMVGAITESVVDHMTPGVFYTMTEIAHMVEKYAPAYANRRASVGAVTNGIRDGKVTGVTYGHNGTASGGTRES